MLKCFKQQKLYILKQKLYILKVGILHSCRKGPCALGYVAHPCCHILSHALLEGETEGAITSISAVVS